MCRRNRWRESRRRFNFSNNPQPKRRASGRRKPKHTKGAAKYRRNQHHIFCQQRFPELRNEPWNIVDVNVIQHDRYHWLFKNRTPEEIIDYLVNYFWGGYVPATIQLCTPGASEAAG